MVIIKSKYILSTLTAITLLFTSFHHLEACCGDEEDKAKTEKTILITKPPRPVQETGLPLRRDFIDQQPMPIREQSALSVEISAEKAVEKNTGSLSHSATKEVDFAPKNFLPPANAGASVPYSAGASLLDSLGLCGDTTLDTSNSSASGTTVHRLGLAEFEKQEETLLSYVSKHLPVRLDFQISYSKKQLVITSTPEDGVEMQLILTYLTQEDSKSDLLKSCFSSKVKPGRSVKDILISPSLRLHIEKKDENLYKRLAGVLVYAHNHANGNIFCQKGLKEYAETLFEIKDDKLPSEYPFLYVITGPTSSSNLRTKRHAFSQ
ncbi:MAG: hypothetical protein B7Y25_05915 [Alphaproteobacteria bacterium 16-39-46]|nr:MAG: hypothetical protein B7Y25_05915 [Alphaproteobacteria bacterium 16-39-46]OZA42461.1 MAG: hypothetical protein B7X84_05975 [Alphaproteobacteria bacterium 17-39-52]HQS83542.1 hypothetical protein [Alphaproteobacteria bacterium]HQS93309.1 hypothetical protein [Alphaproteobacteria bacterium]